jgi:hypothetical protein
MPITIAWDNDEKTVLRLTAADRWNWNDFHKSMRVATFWLDTVDHAVEMIVDLSQSERLPAGALGHIRSLGTQIHPNGRARLLIIGLDESVTGPLGGKDNIYHDSTRLIHFVEDEDQAQAILGEWLAEED